MMRENKEITHIHGSAGIFFFLIHFRDCYRYYLLVLYKLLYIFRIKCVMILYNISETTVQMKTVYLSKYIDYRYFFCFFFHQIFNNILK